MSSSVRRCVVASCLLSLTTLGGLGARLILADNGSPWHISGALDRRWNDDDLHRLDRLTGHDFQLVDTRSLPRPGL
jgi:hypothetical protein